MQDTPALEDLAVFEGVAQRELDTLRRAASLRKFRPGDDLLRAGQHCPGLFVVRSGSVSALVADASGAESEVGSLGVGDSAGEMALLTGEACSATVRAMTRGEAWFFPREDFLSVLEHSPVMWRNMGRILSRRLAATSKQLASRAGENMVALVTDLKPETAGSLVTLVADSLAARLGYRTLVIGTAPPHPAHATGGLPGLADLLADRSLLVQHERRISGADPAGLAAFCLSGIPDAAPEQLGRVLDWLRPLYDWVIAVYPAGHRLEPAVRGQFRSVMALVSRPSRSVPEWLQLYLEQTPGNSLDISVITGHEDAPYLVEELEGRIAECVGRVRVNLDALANGESPGDSDQQAIDRLARRIADAEVGLALGAGAAKGFAH
jgi:CRP-like cAMP-binding protein